MAANQITITLRVRWPLLCAVLCWCRLGWLARWLCIRLDHAR